MKHYTAEITRVDDYWSVDFPTVNRNLFTDGNSIVEAKKNAIDAITVWFDCDEGDFTISFDYPGLGVEDAIRLREEEDDIHFRRIEALNAAIRSLVLGEGLSYRDTAEILGISHSRVQQLMHGAAAS